MNQEISLSGKKVLVTGATGFIGSRLVEYLVACSHACVRALVRNYGRAVTIARLPVELVTGNLADPDSLRRAVNGCEIVFHCAAGTTGEDDERIAATVDGTRNILQAAIEAGVQRFIHISSVAVYGPNPGQVVDETTSLIKSGDLYADSKLKADVMVSRFGVEKGLPVTILRPAIVYGPRAGGWTLGPVSSLRSGKLSLIDGGQGLANYVYIDDVIQAMLLAATRPLAVGEDFVIASGTAATWKDFFGYYASFLGVEIPSVSSAEIDNQRSQLAQLGKPMNMGLTFLASPHARAVIGQIPLLNGLLKTFARLIPAKSRSALENRAAGLRAIKLNPPVLPKPWMVELYRARGICSIDKARRLLGYEPQVSLSEGMRLTEAWLRYTRAIPAK